MHPIIIHDELYKNPIELKKYESCAEELLSQKYTINHGEKLQNILLDLEAKGINIYRSELEDSTNEYIKAGLFLKTIAYNFDLISVRKKFDTFVDKRDNLIESINSLIKNIKAR